MQRSQAAECNDCNVRVIQSSRIAPPLPLCRPAILAGFQSPEDFTVREQSLNYNNGDSYKVGEGHRTAGRAAGSGGAPPPLPLRLLSARPILRQWLTRHLPIVRASEGSNMAACTRFGDHHNCFLQGETLGNLRHGRGTHTCSNGDVYEGQWRYDSRDGTGKITFTSGLRYEGEWKGDKAHG